MQKVVKVNNVPQGKGYVPGIRIAGVQLGLFGFQVNDMVLIEYKQKKITIQKVTSQDLFDRMAKKNHNLKRLAKELDLILT
jgi:hypothetical protein